MMKRNNSTSVAAMPPTKKTKLEFGSAESRQRKRDKPVSVGNKSRSTTAPSRGLRHFSMKVCEKVEEKGTTTYNEVADEVSM